MPNNHHLCSACDVYFNADTFTKDNPHTCSVPTLRQVSRQRGQHIATLELQLATERTKGEALDKLERAINENTRIVLSVVSRHVRQYFVENYDDDKQLSNGPDLRAAIAAIPEAPKPAESALCGGCNVRPPWEHRCCGGECPCEACRGDALTIPEEAPTDAT